MCDLINCFGTSEAYATIIAALIGLIGGLAAVGGAIWVAGRQSTILQKQTEIASRMVEIEEMKLKTDLYDRRIEVFSAMREVLGIVARSGRVPGYERTAGGDIFANAEFLRFQNAMGAAQFLFGGATRKSIEDIYRKLDDLSDVTDTIRDDQRGMTSVELTAARKKKSDLRGELTEAFSTLENLFPELNLTVASDRG